MKKKRKNKSRSASAKRTLPILVVLSAGLWAGTSLAHAADSATVSSPVKNVDLSWIQSSAADADPVKAPIAVSGNELRINAGLHAAWLLESDMALSASSTDTTVATASFDGKILVVRIVGAGGADIVLTASKDGQTLKDTIRLRAVKIGDTTGDGVVTSADALYITKVATGKVVVTSPEELNALDINRDGVVTSADASLLLSKYVNKGNASDPTAYIVSLSSVNDAPVAYGAAIKGLAVKNGTLTATAGYTYQDSEGDAEGATATKWYRGLAKDGSDKEAIAGAQGLEYAIKPSDAGYYLFFEATPKAVAGTLAGQPAGSGPGVLMPDTTPPTVDSVTLPVSGVYKAGRQLRFTVKMSESVTVTGTPTLAFSAEGASKQAAFNKASSTGDKLVFDYAVADGDTAISGIAVGALELGEGGSVKDMAGNDAVLTFTPPSGAGVIVDTTAPAVSAVHVPFDGTYKFGDKLTFTVDLDEAVDLDGGEPTLALDIGGVSRHASYNAVDSSSTKLVFEYALASGDLDADGIGIGNIGLGTGTTIRDAAGNDAKLALGTPSGAGIKVDAVAPKVSKATLPDDGRYIAGQSLTFKLETNEAVVVTGTPTLSLRFGDAIGLASYDALNSTPTSLAFTYTVVPKVTDADGISVGAVTLKGGAAVRDVAGNEADLTFDPPSGDGIIIDTIAPAVKSIELPELPESGIFKAGDKLTFALNLDEAVELAGGQPSLSLNIGGVSRSSEYVAADRDATKLVFAYTVQPGDLDADGISLGSVVLGPGTTLKDAAGNEADLALGTLDTASIKVDAVAPTVSQASLPAPGAYGAGRKLTVKLKLSEAVKVTGTPTLGLQIGSNARMAAYDAEASKEGEDILAFSYTIQAGEIDADGISVGAVSLGSGDAVRDAAGNDAVLTFTPPSGAGVLVDTKAPAVKSVELPAPRSYKMGDKLTFAVELDEAVAMSGGEPTLALNIGGIARTAVYQASDSTTTNLVFVYTIASGDLDTDGIGIGAIELGTGATIRDAAGNDANLALGALSGTGINVDSIAPKVSKATMPDTGLFKVGKPLVFELDTDEAVVVTGTPTLSLKIGDAIISAAYDAVNSTSQVLSFSYTVQAGDNDADGISVGAVTLSGGATVRDAAGNDADLTFDAGDTSGVLVDALAPTVESVSPANGSTGIALASPLSLTMSENVTAASGKKIKIVRAKDNAVVAEYDSDDTTKVQVDGTGVTLVNPGLADRTEYMIVIDIGAFKDAAGNDFAGLSGISGWSFSTPDLTAPVLVAASPTVGSTLTDRSAMWTLTFDEAIDFADATKHIVVRKASDNSEVASYTAANQAGVLEIEGPALKIKPPTLADSTAYYVEIETGAFSDLAGNAYTGLSGPNAWSFSTTVPVNPTLTAVNDEEFSEPRMISDYNGAVLNLTLTDDVFKDEISASDVVLNHAPQGMSVSDIVRLDATHAALMLYYDGTDFDADITNFSVTIAGNGLQGGHSVTSGNITIQAEIEPAERTFISEYWYNGGTGVAIELHNSGAATESGYTLEIYTAEAPSSPYKVNVMDLPPNAVYVVIDSRFYGFFDLSSSPYYNEDIMLAPSNNLSSIPTITGIVLKKGTAVIDKVGSPGSSTPLLAAKNTMRRNGGTKNGSPAYHDYQWSFIPDPTGSGAGISRFP